MKTKVGTLIEESLLQRLKERALRDHKAINQILEEAITAYLQGNHQRELRLAAVKRFCSRPFRLTTSEINQDLAEDYYDQ
jgi:hypothetical protein